MVVDIKVRSQNDNRISEIINWTESHVVHAAKLFALL